MCPHNNPNAGLSQPFPIGRWSTHPTYQQLEQSAEQFDNQSDSRASRPHIAPALKVSDSPPAHLHVIPGEARAGGGGEAGKAGCRLFEAARSVDGNAEAVQTRTRQHESSGEAASSLTSSTARLAVHGVSGNCGIMGDANFEASGGVESRHANSVQRDGSTPSGSPDGHSVEHGSNAGTEVLVVAQCQGRAGVAPGPLASSLNTSELNCESGRSPRGGNNPLNPLNNFEASSVEGHAPNDRSANTDSSAAITRSFAGGSRESAKPVAVIKPGLASFTSLADQAACSMTIREQISLMRRGDKFHFIALATNLIQVLENERNAVVDRIAEMED